MKYNKTIDLILDFLLYSAIALGLCSIFACSTPEQTAPCPPKSDTQVIADTISDILVPKYRWGC